MICHLGLASISMNHHVILWISQNQELTSQNDILSSFDVTLTSSVMVFWVRIEITCQEGLDVAGYGCMTIIISSWKGLSGLSCV